MNEKTTSYTDYSEPTEEGGEAPHIVIPMDAASGNEYDFEYEHEYAWTQFIVPQTTDVTENETETAPPFIAWTDIGMSPYPVMKMIGT